MSKQINYCAAIAALFAEHRKIPTVTAGVDRKECLRIYAMQANIRRQQRELQEQAAKEFAALNGWRHSKRVFSIKTLARGGTHAARGEDRYTLDPHSLLDHSVYFRELLQPYRPVAIVGQPYGSLEKGIELAHSLKLELHTPPNSTASWWYPGQTQFFCLTRPGDLQRAMRHAVVLLQQGRADDAHRVLEAELTNDVHSDQSALGIVR
jgi:hypothetical protein